MVGETAISVVRVRVVGSGFWYVPVSIGILSWSPDVREILFRLRDHKKNENDFKNIEKNIETYFEFPPLYKYNEDSTAPILTNNEMKFEISNKELLSYNFITFVKLI